MKQLLVLIMTLVMTGCGTLANITTLNAVDFDAAVKWAGMTPQAAENIPMGGLYHDGVTIAYGITHPISSDELKNTLVHANILVIPGIIFLIAAGGIELGLTAAGDIITLPYTSFKTIQSSVSD